jgi:hypothetical protein
LEQNYFQFDQQYYKQTKSPSIGNTSGNIHAAHGRKHIYIYIYPILKTQEIIAYYRYVDDIYDQNKTNIEQTLNEFNNIISSVKFTIEKEQHKKIAYLDIKIHRKEIILEFLIYRKPTQTDIIIPNSPCYLYEHKLAGIKYLLDRLHT